MAAEVSLQSEQKPDAQVADQSSIYPATAFMSMILLMNLNDYLVPFSHLTFSCLYNIVVPGRFCGGH